MDPGGEITGILQICHGMVEYIDRYDEFARYLADRGIYVVGHDHLGHGKSVCTEEDHGHFDETKGNSYVLGDIHVLRQRTMKKYPGLPYFILGHSMGSFLVRQYLPLYGQGLAGAIVMGTGSQPMVSACRRPASVPDPGGSEGVAVPKSTDRRDVPGGLPQSF